MLKQIFFYLRNRFILFILLAGLLAAVNYYFTGRIVPSTDPKDTWFYSGLILLLFSAFFIEPFYSSPKNVLTNSVPLFIVYISVYTEFRSPLIWYISVGLISLLILLSIIAITQGDSDESPDSTRNRISTALKWFVVLVGRAKVIYSAVFLSFLFLYTIQIFGSTSSPYMLVLTVYWGLILLIDTKALHNRFANPKPKESNDAVGEVIGVLSDSMVLAKLFKDKSNLSKFELVRFKSRFASTANTINTGFVFDTYTLNDEKRAKILVLKYEPESENSLKDNVICRLTNENERKLTANELNLDRFVGVVKEGSDIGSIRFEYSKKTNNLQEGDLLTAQVGEKCVYYQVFRGSTGVERLESKNESAFIDGEAMQLGVWDEETLSFEKYGWVPGVNTPLFIVEAEQRDRSSCTFPEIELGLIPNTNLPAVINLHDAVSHHIALLGVTGAGKSFLARELIANLRVGTKVICIDFTGEYKEKLLGLKPEDVVDRAGIIDFEDIMAKKADAKEDKKKNKEVLDLRNKAQAALKEKVKAFVEGGSQVGLFELPSLSNTTFLLEFTQYFVEAVFNYAKENQNHRLCLVLEEAHTIVPETGFLGDLGDYGSTKALVNKMAQIALQGRKYGVGLMIIAQRTANVSKTVLTQCNTVICFQAFDDTSMNFLGNYLGKDLIRAVPTLKKYHAVVAGKGMRSPMPMIVNLERKLAGPSFHPPAQ